MCYLVSIRERILFVRIVNDVCDFYQICKGFVEQFIFSDVIRGKLYVLSTKLVVAISVICNVGVWF